MCVCKISKKYRFGQIIISFSLLRFLLGLATVTMLIWCRSACTVSHDVLVWDVPGYLKSTDVLIFGERYRKKTGTQLSALVCG